MKKVYLLLVFCCLSISGFSTTWYSQGATAVTTLTNWNSIAGGGGTNPTVWTNAADIWIIQSNMTITGAATWAIAGSLQFNSNRIGKAAAAGNSVITIGGNLTMATGTTITAAAGSAGTITINLAGNLSLVGTSLITNLSTTTGYNILNFNGAGTLLAPQTVTWTSTGVSTKTALTVNTGTFVKMLSNVPCPTNATGGITVNGALVCGTFVLSSGTTDAFTVSAGGSLYTANAAGINGSVTAMASTSFSGAGNYIYNSTTAAQATGTFLPAAILSGGSVTIDNTFGAVTLSQTTNFASGAALDLETGTFTNTAANLVMASGSNVNRDNGTLAVTPTTYSGINLTYKSLGVNTAAVTTGLEFPATFNGNVTVNKAGATITLQNTKTLPVLATFGNVTLTAGTLASGNFNLALSGNWANNAATTAFTPGTGTVTMNGTAAQGITGTFGTNFNILTIDNAAGVTLTPATTFISGATLNLETGAFTNTGANLIMNSGSNVNRDNGTLAATPTTYSGVNLTYSNLGVNAAAVTTALEWPNPFTGSVTVSKTGATITLNGNKADTGPITLTAGTLDASVTNYNISLTGNWLNNAATTAFTAQSGTVTMNGAAAQTLGGTVGTTFNNFTLSNAAGVTLGATENVNGTLTLTTGVMSVGANNVVLGLAAPAVAPGAFSSSNMIETAGIGQVRKLMNAPGSFLFPIGDGFLNYTPITLNFTAGTFGPTAYAGVSVTPAKHPNNVNVTDYLSRYWSVTTPGITALLATATATYVAGDVVGSEANISIGQYTGALPWLKYGVTDIVTHTLTSPAIASLTNAFSGISTAGPSVSATAGAASVCIGTGTSLTATSVTGDPTLTYSWAPSTGGLSSTVGSPVTATPSVTTTYTLTVTDGNGFTATATTTIIANSAPPAIAGGNLVCISSILDLTDGLTGGTWASSTSNATINVSTGAVFGISAGTTTISYQVGGCYALEVVTVNTPTTAIGGPTTVCTTDFITLTDAVSSGAWTSSDPTTGSVGSATGVVTGVAAGTVTISYTTPSCNSSTYLITVNAYPAPISVAGPVAICVNNSITLTDLTPGGAWTSSAPFTAPVGAGGFVFGSAAGPATISYTLSGCTVTQFMTVNPLPASITGPAGVCVLQTVTLNDASGGGTWTSSNPSSASVGSVTGVVGGVSAGGNYITYTFTATGCYTSFFETVNPLPASISGSSTVCIASQTTYVDATGSGVWSSFQPTIASADATSGAITGVSIATTTISYTLILTGCYVTQVITVDPLPAAITGSTTIVCAGSTITLADVSTPGTWSSGESWIASVGPASGVVTGVTGGATASISYTINTGCSSTYTVNVATPPAPIMGDSTLCVTYSTLLTDSISGGTWSSLAPGSAIASPSGSILGIAPGVVTIEYTITGCAPATHNVTVNPIPAGITGTNSLCDAVTAALYDVTTGGVWSSNDDSIAIIDPITGVATGVSLGTTVISYTLATGCYVVAPVTVNPLAPPIAGTDTICATGSTWLTDIVGGGSWTSSNPAVATIDPVSGLLTGLVTGITYIVYTLPTGCSASLLETSIPSVPAIASFSHVCSGSVIDMTDGETGGTWSSDNNYIASVTDSAGVLSGHFPGSVTISYTISAFKGCYSTEIITVNPLPTPVITYNFPSHSASTFNYYLSYQWYNDHSGLIPGATTPTLVLPYNNDSVYVTVTDTNECTASAGWYFYDFSGVNNVTKASVRIYPNPATSSLFIESATEVRAVISGVDGNTVMEQADAKEMNISKLVPGIYMIALYDSQGQMLTVQKLVKE